MEIRINLLRDLGQAVRRSMSDEGYDVSPIEGDDHKTLVVWNKVKRYDIEPRPRQVLKAHGFNPKGHEPQIDNLENAIRECHTRRPTAKHLYVKAGCRYYRS